MGENLLGFEVGSGGAKDGAQGARQLGEGVANGQELGGRLGLGVLTTNVAALLDESFELDECRPLGVEQDLGGSLAAAELVGAVARCGAGRSWRGVVGRNVIGDPRSHTRNGRGGPRR